MRGTGSRVRARVPRYRRRAAFEDRAGFPFLAEEPDFFFPPPPPFLAGFDPCLPFRGGAGGALRGAVRAVGGIGNADPWWIAS